MNVDSHWKSFKDNTLRLRDLFIPKKKNSNQLWKEKGCTPISADLRNKIREKERSHRKWFNSSNEGSRSHYRSKDKVVRNSVKKMVIQERKDYEQMICN